MSKYDAMVESVDVLWRDLRPRAHERWILRQAAIHTRIARLADETGVRGDFRRRAMVALHDEGFSIREIGEAYRVAKQRVSQIINQSSQGRAGFEG